MVKIQFRATGQPQWGPLGKRDWAESLLDLKTRPGLVARQQEAANRRWAVATALVEQLERAPWTLAGEVTLDLALDTLRYRLTTRGKPLHGQWELDWLLGSEQALDQAVERLRAEALGEARHA